MSNIVEANKEFSINSSIDKIWLFFSDIGKLLSCIPDCQNITVKNSEEAEISIKMKVVILFGIIHVGLGKKIMV